MASDLSPKNVDISSEQGVLSAIFNHGLQAMTATEDFGLSAKDFFYETNGFLFHVMNDILTENPTAKIDQFGVIARAKKLGFNKFVAQIGDTDFLKNLTVQPVSIDSVRDLAEAVRKKSIFRDISDKMTNLAKEVDDKIDSSSSLEDLMFLVENKTGLITESISNPNAKFQKLGDGFGDWVQYLEDNPCDCVGVPSGFPTYDASIGGGFRRRSVNMLGARSGKGKSLLSLVIGNNIVSKNIPVLYLDTELEKESQLARLAACRSGVPITEIENGKFSKDPRKKKALKDAVTEIEALKLYHQYIGGWTFEQIISYAKTWLRQVVGYDEDGNINDCLIVYDYLKMMSVDGLGKIQEYQMLGFQMTMMHDFAVRYDVPIFVLIQLNRDGINNEGQGVAAGSDRTEWLASSFAIFKDKTDDELGDSGQFGSKKIIVVKSRFGAGTPAGDYINVVANTRIMRLEEGGLASLMRKQQQQRINEGQSQSNGDNRNDSPNF